MAKYGINKDINLKIIGILDIRKDNERLYVEIDGETYPLTEILEDYDGEVVSISTSKSFESYTEPGFTEKNKDVNGED